MSITKIFRPKFIALGVVALVFASTSYGFAAANTVASTNAGDGNQLISGYSVSAIKYTLNATNPANVDSVAFSVTGGSKPQTVKAKVVGSSTTYADCTTSSTASPYAFSCNTPGASVTQADNLRVIAAD